MDKSKWIGVAFLLTMCLLLPTVQTATKEVCMIDLVILVDRSGSIVDAELGHSQRDMDSVKSFLKTIISSYTISQEATKIALLTFASRVRVEFGFGDRDPPSRSYMEEKINNISPGGHTATALALREALDAFTELPGTREEASKVVLMMTDGLPTKNLAGMTIDDRERDGDTEERREMFIQEALEQAYMLRAETGAKILALGVTSRVNRADFLRNMADENSYFQAEDFTQLMEKVTDIRDDSCRRVPAGSCTLDVAFAVDMSGSVGRDVYNLKNFLRSLIHELEAMDPRIHTALIRFANRARVFKPLDVYSPTTMDWVIQNLPGPAGYTATAHALKLAADIFSGREGDRPGRGNVLVVLSDGLPSLALDGTRIEPYSPTVKKQRVYQEVLDQADLLKRRHHVEIFSVVVDGKEGINTDLLDEISSSSTSLRVHQFSELMDNINTIKQAICHDASRRRKRSSNNRYQGERLLKQMVESLRDR